jgi:hypothetical protein
MDRMKANTARVRKMLPVYLLCGTEIDGPPTGVCDDLLGMNDV